MSKARDLASAIPAPSTVSSAELGYLDGVTSAIQTQVDAKLATTTATSTYIPKTLTTTTGDTIYASSANTPARLGIGTTGQVLTVASGLPSWATASTGAVKQIKFATSVDNIATTSTTFVTTGLAVTITPSSASSKIMLSLSGGAMYLNANGTSCGLVTTFYNGATNVIASAVTSGEGISYYSCAASVETSGSHSMTYIDSPASTSAITYTVYFKATNSARNAYFNAFGGPARGMITLTAMEITV
jgi:hypothetical protein